jgi:hypothetical protein
MFGGCVLARGDTDASYEIKLSAGTLVHVSGAGRLDNGGSVSTNDAVRRSATGLRHW